MPTLSIMMNIPSLSEPPVRASGVVILRPGCPTEVLLMEHHNRLDFPKGHLEKGETILEGALRELEEETGINPTAIRLIEGFRHVLRYTVADRKNPGQLSAKEVYYFAAWLDHDQPIISTEHAGHRWVPFQPPFTIQKMTIDEVLTKLAAWLKENKHN